jgi:tetratricopeptide (TPR) repeat protein
VGRHQQAWEYLLARNFHPWEGGEGKVPAQYTLCLTQLARKSIAASEFDAALGWLRRADDWPHCLGEGKLPNHQDNNVRYWQGVALTKLGREAEAREALERAAQGMSQPSDPMYYNDQPPDMIFYQGRALKSLDRHEDATARFQSLIDYGDAHLADEPEIDFFAVSLPDFLVFEEDLKRRNEMHCRYMIALGLFGQNRPDEATTQFDQILAIDPSYFGAVIHHPSIGAEEQV